MSSRFLCLTAPVRTATQSGQKANTTWYSWWVQDFGPICRVTGSSFSQAMEGLTWKPCPLYPFTFVLVFHTGMGTGCATLVCVERSQPAEGGQMERNWVKNLPRWEVFQLWWDNSFHVLWDLRQIIPHIWNNGRPKHWEEPALHFLSRFQESIWCCFPEHSPGETVCSWFGQVYSVWKTGWMTEPRVWWWMELNPVGHRCCFPRLHVAARPA